MLIKTVRWGDSILAGPAVNAVRAARKDRTLQATRSSSRPKRMLIKLLEEKFPGYNAVVSMARLANDKSATNAERFAADKEVAKYMHPQLKAVDLTSAGEGITFNFSIGQQPTTLDDDVIDAGDT